MENGEGGRKNKYGKRFAMHSQLILLSITRVHYVFNASLSGMLTAYKCVLLAEYFFPRSSVLHQQELSFLKKKKERKKETVFVSA